MTVLQEECGACGRMVMETGAEHVIEFALDRDGNHAAIQFLEELGRSRRGIDWVADMLVRVEDFAQTGKLEVPRELNELRDGLWELKAQKLRLPFFYLPDGGCASVRITHGFVKGTQETPRREIDRGLAIMREDMQR